MTYKTLARICATISFLSLAYMYLIIYEGTYFGWTVFFVFLVFAILFNKLDEQQEEIEILRLPKEEKQILEKIQKFSDGSGIQEKNLLPKDNTQVVFQGKIPNSIPKK